MSTLTPVMLPPGMSQTLNEADLDGIAGQGSDRDLVRLLLEKQRGRQ